MKQYYISQEYQGGSINIAENLDRYTKLQTYVGAALTEYTGLSTNTEPYSETILNLKHQLVLHTQVVQKFTIYQTCLFVSFLVN